MSTTLVTGIGELVTNDETLDGADHTEGLGLLRDAAVVVDGRGGALGRAGRARAAMPTDGSTSVGGRSSRRSWTRTRTWCSPATAAAEFAARMTGVPYDGGGIATTVARHPGGDATTSCAASSAAGFAEMRAQGTTTVEIKSGYGLTVADEARALRIAARVHRRDDVSRRARVPAEYADRRAEYLDLVTGPMLRGLRAARPVGRRVLRAAQPARLHRRRGAGGAGGRPGRRAGPAGARQPARARARACNWRWRCRRGQRRPLHVPVRRRRRRAGRGGRTTVATLLPGVEFSTRSPYPDGRRLLDAGVSVALATDCNPGTCYSSSMPFVIALAVREMRLTPAEALRAATVGGAQVVAAQRHRPDRGRRARRPHGAGRAVVPASDLPGGRADRAGTGPAGRTDGPRRRPAPARHQMRTRSSGASHRSSPSLTSNAS